jgi:hypothetical protein
MMRAKLIAALVVIVPAWAMLPLGNQIYTENVQLKYGSTHVTRELRDRIGQGMAIALLAGFRGVVADFVWIESHSFFERKEWVRQYSDMQVASILQPQSILFWDLGSWHMAWNIGYAVSIDPANRTHAEGIKRQREWWDKARDYLERGIENNPNQYDLYFKLAWLYQNKYEDYCKAEQYYAKAISFPDVPSYLPRMYARAKEKCGDVLGAYKFWRGLWLVDHNKVDEPWGVIQREGSRLEDVLNIPKDQRVFPPDAPKSTGPTT